MESDPPHGVALLPAAAPPRQRDQPLAADDDGAREPWFHRLLGTTRAGDYRRGFYAFTAFLAVLTLLLNFHGPCLQTAWGHDAIGFLAAAWKVRCGVLPHVGYHSALGALNAWILAGGLWLLGPTDAVLPFCNSLVAVALGGLAFVVARPRLPAVPTVLFAFTQTILAATPHLLRFTWPVATYDGYYNRQGYALVSILLLLLFLPPRPGAARRGHGEARLAGGILGVLLFLKISYFMAGGGLCVLALGGSRRFSRAWVGNCLAAGAVVAAACLPLIGFDVLALWRDLRLAADVRMGNPEETFAPGRYLGWLPDAWLEIALLATMQMRLGPPLLWRRGGTPSWAEFAGIVAGSAFVCMTNSASGTRSDTPLLTSWLFVLLGSALREPPVAAPAAGGRWFEDRLPVLCSLSGVLWVYTFGDSLRSLAWSVSPWPTAWQQTALRLSPPIAADPLRGLRVLDMGGEFQVPDTYAGKINDGLRLLRALGGTHRVEAFDFVNPFPFALGWPAARGGIWCWHNGYSFSAAYHPSAEEAFGGADVVMIPKYPGHPESFGVMTRLYGPYVEAHFRCVAQSGQWFVLQRR